MQYKAISAILTLFFLVTFTATGQKQINSPYARFNLGNLEPAASFKSLGMGGIGVGMKSNNSIYFANPASYSSIDTNSFIFDIGLDFGILKLSDGEQHFSSNDMNFDHLLIGFPLAKGFGVAVGIVPVSSGYYKLAESVTKTDPDYDPLVGEYTSVHSGDGGFNNFFLGTGLKINKNFSLGVNMMLMFGELKRAYTINYDDYTNAYQNNATEKIEMHGINFNYGLHYTAALKNDYFLNAGISFTAQKNFTTGYSQLAYKYTAYSTRDTISYISDDSTKTFIPGTLGLGFTFGKLNKFTVGFDYIMTRWSGSVLPGGGNYAADSRSFRFGLEYIPDKYSNYSLIRRLEYRAGAHIGDTYLVIKNEQIKEFGASLGLGIPMRRTYSRTNLFFDFTRKNGSGVGTVHRENFYTMGISLNLYDFWFIKRKYE
ncbi:MAG: hypothetical protein IPN67_17430 [Bacteroidales bacterium]|nr:hypothetical protein [Bacteroidales bacterium]MBK8884084.1 hypothetical protein [Bacteroidales bacterium]